MELISAGSVIVSSTKIGQIKSLTSSAVSLISGRNLDERSLRMRMVGNIDVLLDGKYLMITEWKSILLNKEFIMPEEIKIMDPKNKTLIPLVIIFFIFGVVVGYVAHKPETVEKIVEKETIVNVTVTQIPTPIPTPTPTPTPTATVTPLSNFTVKDYNPSTDIPTKTIVFETNYVASPNEVAIHPGESVLIKITDYTLPFRLTLVLDLYQKDIGASGAAFVTFNKKGIYHFKGIILSGDPNVLPKTYAEGTIGVY